MKYLLLSIFFCSILSISHSQDYLITDLDSNYSTLSDNQNNTKDDDINSSFLKTFTPSYSIIRSTTGSGGSSKTIQTNKGKYTISQSIGQLGVIGTHSKNNHAILQGYQQNRISFKVFSTAEDNTLKATVYPNPFSQSINILFDEIITDDLFINVFDITGKAVISTKVPGSKLVTLPINNITYGTYILKATEGKKHFIVNIIKQ